LAPDQPEPIQRAQGLTNSLQPPGLGERAGVNPILDREIPVDETVFQQDVFLRAHGFKDRRVEMGQELVAIVRLQIGLDIRVVDAAFPGDQGARLQRVVLDPGRRAQEGADIADRLPARSATPCAGSSVRTKTP